jgi:para-nitrobenzyl esterase
MTLTFDRRRAIVGGAALVGLGLGGGAGVAPAETTTSVVDAPAGRLVGSTSGGVARYLGMPYAQPPVGELRWRAPQPFARWSGVREAYGFGPAPRQPVPPGAPSDPAAQSEDCLTINVWTPAAHSSRPRPVMVWIYGGGFVGGASGLPVYDGGSLARKGVVVVSFNYRVGRLGFFAHPALSAIAPKGEPLANYGLMDQIAALAWVRDNIASFGGDPENVTIFGESAGATSVAMMLGAPAAASLFHKAIIQSTGAWPVTPLADHAPSLGLSGELRGRRLARLNGCGDNDLAALRALPFEALAKDAGLYDNWPVVDGTVVPTDPLSAWATGAFSHKPLIIGCTSWEGGVFGQADRGQAPLLLAPLGSALAEIAAAYPEYAGRTDDQRRLKIAGDVLLTMPSRRMAQQASRFAPTWHYSFAYLPESVRSTLPGVPHGGDVPFVFQTLAPGYLRQPQFAPSAADLAMADMVSDYWVSFARDGEPRLGSGTAWPNFTAEAQNTMLFSETGASAVKDLHRARLDHLEYLLT